MFKKVFLATAILGSIGSSCAMADNITWEPHIRDGYMCSGAPNYCNISGMAKLHIENTSADVHTYSVHLGMTSDAGEPVGGAGKWEANITIQPHASWDTQQTVAGYVKFNNRGQREISIVAYMTGNQEFYQAQKGWIQVV